MSECGSGRWLVPNCERPNPPLLPPPPPRSTLIEAVVASGVLPRLVSLMGHSELIVVVPALRVTGNIISGTERHTQAALDAGALRFITPLLTHTKRTVRREACWTVSNVAAGTKLQISSMLSTPGLTTAVLHQLRQGDWNVKKEVCAGVQPTVGWAQEPSHAHAPCRPRGLLQTLPRPGRRSTCAISSAWASSSRSSRCSTRRTRACSSSSWTPSQPSWPWGRS